MLIALLSLSLLLDSDLAPPPGDPRTTDSMLDLGMPGEKPIEWIEPPPDDNKLSFEMRGSLVTITPERVVVGRVGEVDAEFRIAPGALFFVDDEAVAFDELPMGREARIVYVLEGADQVATEIRVGAASAPSAPGEAPLEDAPIEVDPGD